VLRKCKSQGAGGVKRHALAEFCCALGTDREKEQRVSWAHRSARHIDAESTAADMNVPKEVRWRVGKRACSPVKEL
jgi:hypothetical protein